jgi:hypothetical protein
MGQFSNKKKQAFRARETNRLLLFQQLVRGENHQMLLCARISGNPVSFNLLKDIRTSSFRA